MATKEITGLPVQTSPGLDDIIQHRDSGAGADKQVTLQLIQYLMISVLECNNDGAQSIVAGSEKSYTDQDYVALIAALRTKAPNPNSIVSGYAATGIPITAGMVTITTPAAPVDGRSMSGGGTWDSDPHGSISDTYYIEIFSPTEFRWQKNADGWSAGVTITGAAQALSDGVTVTFSTTTGWTAGAGKIQIDDAGYTANRTFEVDVPNGDIYITGSVTGSHVFTDYAEYFENAAPGEIPIGTIVTEHQGKVCPGSDPGEYIAGIVSASAGVKLGNTPFTWAGRFQRDEWGRIKRNKKGELIENPDYDPAIKNIPRGQRPDEWTLVGLVGQVPTRVKQDVLPGCYVDSDGSNAGKETRLRCMRISKKYDKKKGYAIALCLIR